MSHCGLGSADTGSVVVWPTPCIYTAHVQLIEAMKPKPLADNKLSTQMVVVEEDEEDAFGNLTHLRSNAFLQFKDALGTAASIPFIR